MKVFKLNHIYQMRFIGDSELKPSFECIKLTLKSATFKRVGTSETLRRKIRVYDNCQYIIEGNYSFAPSIRADNVVVSEKLVNHYTKNLQKVIAFHPITKNNCTAKGYQDFAKTSLEAVKMGRNW